MIEYVIGDDFGALPQRNVHNNGAGTQESPAIARLANGGFVIMWRSGSALYAQLHDAQGLKVGGEQLIAANGLNPAVVGLSSGGFAVAWVANDGSLDGVFARSFTATGSPATGVIGVPTSTAGSQQQPALGALADDGFVVAWTDSGTGGGSTVKARILDGAGTAQGSEIVIAATASMNNRFPKIAVQVDGDFVVSWNGPQPGYSSAANAQVFGPAGNAKSGIFSSHDLPSTPGFHDGFYQSIAVLTSGEMVMTWTDETGDGVTIRGQRYTADGVRIGGQFQVNPADGVAAGQSMVTALDNGGFLVTWRPDVAGEGPNYFQRGDIWARAYDAMGAADGSAFRVNTTTALGQDLPAVAAFGSGDFAVVWRNWASAGDTDIAMRVYQSTTTGTTGNDTIIGTPDVDVLRGLDGNDILAGLGAGDILDGGEGNDSLFSGPRTDRVYAVAFAVANGITPTLDRGSEIDTLLGGAGADQIFAGYGDIVDGGANGIWPAPETRDVLYISLMGASAGVSMALTADGIVIDNYMIVNVEDIKWVEGSNFNDIIDLRSTVATSAFNVDAAIYGMAGNDFIVGGSNTVAIFGGDGDDTLDGRTTSFYLQYLSGGDGNDTLYASGSISLNADGGAGDDIIYATYLAHGGTGNDIIYVQTSDAAYNKQIYGDEGDDTIFAADNAGAGNTLPISGGRGSDRLVSGTGANTLVTDVLGTTGLPKEDDFADHDVVEAGGGNDIVWMGIGDDADGGAGTDQLSMSYGGATAGVTMETRWLIGATPFVQFGGTIVNFEQMIGLRGSAFADHFTVNGLTTLLSVDLGLGDDTIVATTSAVYARGQDGNDRFISGTLDDYFDGGIGRDTVDYSTYASAVTVTLNLTGSATGTGPNGDQLLAIEDVYGSAFDDTINGSNAANLLRGNAGNDTLNGRDGNDELDGGTGDDIMNGGTGDDRMTGGIGNDIYIVDSLLDVVTEAAGEGIDEIRTSIRKPALAANVENLTYTGSGNFSARGNGLDNVITGGIGHDVIVGKDGNDRLVGGSGDDMLDGGAGTDIIDGGAGDDLIYVADGSDTVDGGTGRDTVVFYLGDIVFASGSSSNVEVFENLSGGNLTAGLNGSDNMFGGSIGIDTIDGAAGDDVLYGRAGNDVLGGGSGSDRLFGMDDNDVLNGGADNDYLYGDTGDDRLSGDSGDDVLYGDGGDDTLTGGAGQDMLHGGNGGDIFAFASGDSSTSIGTADAIGDFSSAQGDRIDLSAIDAIVGGADDGFAFIGTATFGNSAGQLRYELIGGNTYVMGDTDGDGVADFMIRVDGTVVLIAGDFSL